LKDSFFQLLCVNQPPFYKIKEEMKLKLLKMNNNNNDRLTAFDPGQPG